MKLFVFPRWSNKTRPLFGAVLGIAPLYLTALVWYGFSPKTTDVGYMPTQPIPYSHELHVGQLGLDCRYCHSTVDKAAHSAVPSTNTCMNCHSRVRAKSPKLEALRESCGWSDEKRACRDDGPAIQWKKVHDLPDYVYFNHSAHVTRGIGCVSCHGRIDKMVEVNQVEPLNMQWCLNCHRAPEQYLRPASEVTNMTWVAEGDPIAYGKKLREENNINPPEDCSTCHR
ncbi:MAG: cytochrome c3 family protein [Polyangiaceae bacterium]